MWFGPPRRLMWLQCRVHSHGLHGRLLPTRRSSSAAPATARFSRPPRARSCRVPRRRPCEHSNRQVGQWHSPRRRVDLPRDGNWQTQPPTDPMPPRLVACFSCSICHSDVTDGDPRGRGEAHGTLKPLDWHHKPHCPGNHDTCATERGFPARRRRRARACPASPSARRRRWRRSPTGAGGEQQGSRRTPVTGGPQL